MQEIEQRIALVLGEGMAARYRHRIYQAARPRLPWHFLSLHPGHPDCIDHARRWGATGVITALRSRAEVHALARLHLPIVNLHARDLDHPWPEVGTSIAAQAQMALQHLREAGYPRGIYYGPNDRNAGDQRWQAIRRAAHKAHWPIRRLDPGRIPSNPDDPKPIGINADEPGLIAWLRTLDHPVGVWCGNDTWAFWLAECAHRLGIRVPDRLGILGCGDSPDRCLAAWPPLSSLVIHHPGDAAIAVDLLERQLAEKRVRQAKRTPVTVQPRGSTDRWACEDPVLQDMLDLIRARACRGIGPDGLARSLGIGRRSLENRCRADLGRTPFQLIRHQRLQTAAALLRDTDIGIDTIGEHCGWADASRFSKDFRAAYGVSPSAWRAG